ncbi:MAG: hypothetical protein ACJ746_00605 [Bryobacteraceae bacterium]
MKRKIWIMLALSVIWAVSAGIYTRHSDVERAEGFAKWAYKTCTQTKALQHDSDLSSCETDRSKNMATWMESSTASVLFMALAPIPFFWLSAFILLYLFRIQIAGFHAVVPWPRLTRFKKRFVVFCMLFIAGAIAFGLLLGMNLYVDTQVPVGISSFLDVIRVGDSVSVSGTWTRTDLAGTDDSIMSPLQTSKIECNKAENRCTEALASVSGNTLMSDVVDYEIKSWTPNAIVMQRDLIAQSRFLPST